MSLEVFPSLQCFGKISIGFVSVLFWAEFINETLGL
jgi:hypothetical protein